jgi:hypothetical protein
MLAHLAFRELKRSRTEPAPLPPPSLPAAPVLVVDSGRSHFRRPAPSSAVVELAVVVVVVAVLVVRRFATAPSPEPTGVGLVLAAHSAFFGFVYVVVVVNVQPWAITGPRVFYVLRGVTCTAFFERPMAASSPECKMALRDSMCAYVRVYTSV